ncbi:DUF1109 domain-containing protein [Belnapia sp. T18]|uniref:DUF1109 domain-containing protein n=1 Tax=Belnapia arida TaxID=2804533 RepID=A0ABS1TW89_9PROT|nr:DUF1109 domain-containing protein [Belnapia arida]MBL6076708.1 DUF1109 domain-containing protein [Belnapia arida]
MRSEELIGELAAGLQPVRRMASPWRQAALWLGLAAAAVGTAVLMNGLRHDLHQRMLMPQEVGQWLASVLAGVLAAVAAAMLARPDRSWRWALLPVPALLAWFASLGWGCLSDLARLGPMAGQMRASWPCLRFILAMGLPLAAAQFWLLRHAGPVRPLPVLLVGGLASAALCSAGLSLFHHLDAAVMVLLWHGGAMLMLVLAGALLGRPLFMRRQA